jgi:hypothetical protein
MVEGVLTVRLEWVDIKELVSLQINRSQNIVEQGNFRDIQVLGILVCEEHSKIKENIAHGGTGLVKRIRVG